MMFLQVWGVVDFIRGKTAHTVSWYSMMAYNVLSLSPLACLAGPIFCVSLALCGQWWLFACCVLTLTVTTCVTVHLAFVILNEVRPFYRLSCTSCDLIYVGDQVAASSPQAKGWLVKHGKIVTVIVIAASSRLDMLCIFRLQICGHSITKLPMEDRHFHFLRNAGMFHHLIEDIPHGFVGIARLAIGGIEGRETSSASWLAGAMDGGTVTIISMTLSIASIVFGLLNKSIQFLVLRAGTNSSAVLDNIDRLRCSFGGIGAAAR